MKIVINNQEFDYNTGCGLLKLKYGDTPFKGLEDIWDDIKPLTFKEIARNVTNIEARRVAIACLGTERLVEEVKPKHIKSETIAKKTMWITQSGELVERYFDDTYSLYRVSADDLFGKNSRQGDCYYVSCKDTSTDREYILWVDFSGVAMTKGLSVWNMGQKDIEKNVSPIDCVAWTIQTDIPEGDISYIIRQGDCILVRPKDGKKTPRLSFGRFRHLTGHEYRNLLIAES
jgi:hypothetical protein